MIKGRDLPSSTCTERHKPSQPVFRGSVNSISDANLLEHVCLFQAGFLSGWEGRKERGGRVERSVSHHSPVQLIRGLQQEIRYVRAL